MAQTIKAAPGVTHVETELGYWPVGEQAEPLTKEEAESIAAIPDCEVLADKQPDKPDKPDKDKDKQS